MLIAILASVGCVAETTSDNEDSIRTVEQELTLGDTDDYSMGDCINVKRYAEYGHTRIDRRAKFDSNGKLKLRRRAGNIWIVNEGYARATGRIDMANFVFSEGGIDPSLDLVVAGNPPTFEGSYKRLLDELKGGNVTARYGADDSAVIISPLDHGYWGALAPHSMYASNANLTVTSTSSHTMFDGDSLDTVTVKADGVLTIEEGADVYIKELLVEPDGIVRIASNNNILTTIHVLERVDMFGSIDVKFPKYLRWEIENYPFNLNTEWDSSISVHDSSVFWSDGGSAVHRSNDYGKEIRLGTVYSPNGRVWILPYDGDTAIGRIWARDLVIAPLTGPVETRKVEFACLNL